LILLDYSAIAIGNLFAMHVEIEENIIRHVILNSIRMYNKKYRDKFGKMVICCDGGAKWRKEIFPNYKAGRDTGREESPIDWDEAFRCINLVREELKEHFPYKVVQVLGAEGDDVIATLVEQTQEFGQHEPVMIISADKDFLQLQKYSNVKQFSTITKKLLVEKDPHKRLFEHVCRGDGGDGVPNVLSPDNTFVDGLRQNRLMSKKIDLWYESDDLANDMPEEVYRNFQRNQKVIDLSLIPDGVKTDIINTYANQETVPGKKVMPFLIKKRCRQLIENIGDFI